MNKYIVKRIIRGAITFWTAITVTFLIVRLTPSNPVTIMLDSNATTESIAKLTQDFGLDKPLYVQYIKYIGNLFQGNLGVSFSTRQPVMDLLIERLPWTLLLMITVLINCFLLGIPMGVAAACKKGKTIDHVINIFAVFGTSIFIPSFGITMLYIFGVKFPVLPIGGSHTPGTEGIEYVLDVYKHMILPVATLTFVNLANYVLYIRSSMVSILEESYIRTARSKGMSEQRVVWKHGVRNALIPTITMTGYLISTMIGGSLLTETIFSYPGVGRLVYEAVGKLDYPVLQGAFLMLAVMVVVMGIFTDLLYARLDPRIKLT